MAPGAVTVTVPLAPAVAVTWKLPFPVPEVGETVMFGWLAETLQLTPRLPLNVTVIDCGSVTKELLTPNFSDVRLRDMVVVAPVPNSPKTPTPVVVPTYTLPFTTVGTMNLFPSPNWSRPSGAWLLL